MRVPVPRWPGSHVSVPIGLALYLKEEQARKLKLPSQSRSVLAREIVVAHGGTLELSTHPGEGAKFTMRLPAHRQ